VFKKPAPIKRPSPSSSPGTSSIKPLRGAATLVSQMMDKLKLSSNATEANEFLALLTFFLIVLQLHEEKVLVFL
jgi:hypothetical protein